MRRPDKPESWNDGESYEGKSPRGLGFKVFLSFLQSYRVVYGPDGGSKGKSFILDKRVIADSTRYDSPLPSSTQLVSVFAVFSALVVVSSGHRALLIRAWDRKLSQQ
ncbi:Uncharacterized protein Rs2_35288 [Raphanus sativus]|nr:Uncharacterized protein Rs2_35288 [Raphanus sativus]